MSDETTENMTDDQNTVEEATSATETAQETAEAPTEQGAENGAQEAEEQEQDEQQDQQHPSAQAKKYRLRLRETEAELESAREAVSALQDRVLTSTLAEGIDVIPQSGNIPQNPDGTPKPRTVVLNHPDDLHTIGGVDKADIFTDGDLDRQKLSEAMTTLYAARPELFTEHGPVHQPIPSAGREPDTYAALKGSGGWSDVIRNRG